MTTTNNPERSETEILIERAEEKDYETVGDLVVDAYLAAGYFQDPEHQYLQYVRQVAERAAASEVYVARHRKQTLATMTLVTYGSDYTDIGQPGELEIRMLSVRPDAQRLGIGRAMVQAAIARARELDSLHSISLTTGPEWTAARRLYESMGFVRREERDWYVPNTDVLLIVYTLDLSTGS